MVSSYIRQRITHYQDELNNALENDDYHRAAKCRAVYLELEQVLNVCELRGAEEASFMDGEHYSTVEVAVVLGLHETTVTRKAEKLQGVKVKGKWYFKKKDIELIADSSRGSIKRGRRKKE